MHDLHRMAIQMHLGKFAAGGRKDDDKKEDKPFSL